METSDKAVITVETLVKVPVEKTWIFWTSPEHITKWNTASDDWHTTSAENDLRVDGIFNFRMEAKDGSFGFDFSGRYDEIKINESIIYTLDDGRKVKIIFKNLGKETNIKERFEAEDQNPVDLQQTGWQAILDNFKKYAESFNDTNTV